MKKILTALLLLCIIPAAFADSSSILHPAAITNYTDMSVNYLSQIFGTVGGALEGGHSQMMGKLFYILNNGILLASVVLISYSVLMGSIRLASEGISIQQGKSTLFSVLKLAVGIALIIPSPSTGYSTLQTIVMDVVIQGAGLADSIWDKGLDYLDKGGMVWEQPAGGQAQSQANVINNDNILAMFGANNKVATQIFADEVCMYGSRDPLSSDGNSTSNSFTADAQTRPQYAMWSDDTNHTFNFPGLNDASAVSGSSCGSISWDIKNACAKDGDSANCAAARQSVSAMVTAMLPVAQRYYCQNASADSPTCANVASSLSDDYVYSSLYQGVLNYFSNMQVFAEINGKKADGNKAAFIKGAKKEGWLNAGRYYWDVMQFNGTSQDSSDLSTYVNQATTPDQKALSMYSLNKIVQNASSFIAGTSDSKIIADNNDITQGFANYINSVYGNMDQSNKNLNDNNSNAKPLIIGAAATGVIAPTYIVPGVGVTLTAAASGLDLLGNMFVDPGNNPITFLYSLGQACLKLTISIWVIGGVAIAANLLALGFCQATNPYPVAAQTFTSWFQPMITMIAVMLWASGFFLSYYVPLYPFMIFLFASIGWFISVIEAMVAAPLVALGLTHPENHDFLGKAEQATVLLLGVFIQPSLLVIGLIAGIIFSFVSFQLLIYGYSGFISDIMGSTSNSGHGVNILAAATNSPLYSGSILLTQPLLLVVFCVLAYTLLTQSFSLVFLLRDNVMRWIGAPGSGLQSPEQLVGETRSAVSGLGKSTGDAQAQTGQAISGSGKGMSRSGKAAKDLYDKRNEDKLEPE